MAVGKSKTVIMSISSKTLFHFLPKEQFLMDTLKRGFWPRYTIEHFWGEKHFAIPMVCFCDIPLSQISLHVKKYSKSGGYGIGMSKSWAMKKGITPVLYLSYKNEFMYSEIKNYAKSLSSKDIATNASDMCMKQRLLYYAKRTTESSFELNLSNSNVDEEAKREKKYKYYNEREWRYVPQISEEVHLEIINLKEKEEEKIKNELSEHTRNQWLDFTVNDVEYIFVPSDLIRKTFINTIYKSKNLKEEDKLAYISKLITIKQIKEDF